MQKHQTPKSCHDAARDDSGWRTKESRAGIRRKTTLIQKRKRDNWHSRGCGLKSVFLTRNSV